MRESCTQRQKVDAIVVTSWYTNIPHEDGLEAFCSHLKDQNEPCVDAIVALVRFILLKILSLPGPFFPKKSCTTVGTRTALLYANLFMGRLEQEFF